MAIKACSRIFSNQQGEYSFLIWRTSESFFRYLYLAGATSLFECRSKEGELSVCKYLREERTKVSPHLAQCSSNSHPPPSQLACQRFRSCMFSRFPIRDSRPHIRRNSSKGPLGLLAAAAYAQEVKSGGSENCRTGNVDEWRDQMETDNSFVQETSPSWPQWKKNYILSPSATSSAAMSLSK